MSRATAERRDRDRRVACPVCGRSPGWPCVTDEGVRKDEVHAARKRAAKQATQAKEGT